MAAPLASGPTPRRHPRPRRWPAHAQRLFAAFAVVVVLGAPAGHAVAAPTCTPAALSGQTPAAAAPTASVVEEAYNCLLDNYGGASAASPDTLLDQAWAEASAAAGAPSAPAPSLPPDRAGAYRSFSAALGTLTSGADAATQARIDQAAIKGMTDSLSDDHTTYLPATVFRGELQSLAGRPQIGLGAHLAADPALQQVFFFSLAAGGPAAAAGVQPGDVLEAINGQRIADLLASEQAPPAALAEAISRKSWSAGTVVHLDLYRPRTDHHFSVDVTAAQAALPDLEGGMRSGAAYLHLWLFDGRSARQVQTLLKAEQAQGANAVILDLRDDPGGSLENARAIASMFTHHDPLAIIRGTLDQSDLDADASVPVVTLPVTVLIDSGSASAAEFLAAALQDAHAATIIGTPSAGAIASAELFQLADGSGLEITVAQLLRSTGAPIDGVGVQPDIVAPLTAAALSAGQDATLQAALSPAPADLATGTWVAVVNTAAQLWSGTDGKAISFGAVPLGSRFLIAAPAHGGRYFVFDPRTSNYAWIDDSAVRSTT